MIPVGEWEQRERWCYACLEIVLLNGVCVFALLRMEGSFGSEPQEWREHSSE